jgi:predicted phage baseplate assembly protein
MPLPAPNLDDRRFQDLVDDAKRLVQRRCPEWTDHNVSDPGITLIETFAYLVDQVLYRLNRVPERSYVTFLELMGVELFAPSAATVPVTFWLTAPLEEDRVVEAGTEVATRRRRTSEAIVFRTIDDLDILHCRRTYVMSGGADAQPFDQSSELVNERPVAAFSAVPQVGDTLYVGLDRAVPSCTVAIHVQCESEGHGIDPTDPPWVWEALGADGWVRCDVEDGTGGFNSAGDVVVHVPGSHAEAVVEERSGGWLRCRIIAPEREDQTAYTNSPLLNAVEADTVGGTTTAVHGEDIIDELVGVSQGVPGERFTLLRRPIVASERPVQLEVAGPDGWEPWQQVQSFGESGEDDLHWRLNPNEGALVFGPAVRLADGTLKQYGAVPEFSLMERSGAGVDLAQLRGKIWVADFIYTTCTDTCPLQTGMMARLQEEYASKPDVHLVSVTVDPERDTPQTLSLYAAKHGADAKRWLFLTGQRDRIMNLIRDGFHLSVATLPNGAEQTGMIPHSPRFVLIDKEARIRGYYDSRELEAFVRLKNDIDTLLKS